MSQTRDELVSQFDALTVIPQTVLGVWQHSGQRYEELLVRYYVDVDDTEDNLCCFTNLKSKLLERFEQIDIYIVSYPVEVH